MLLYTYLVLTLALDLVYAILYPVSDTIRLLSMQMLTSKGYRLNPYSLILLTYYLLLVYSVVNPVLFLILSVLDSYHQICNYNMSHQYSTIVYHHQLIHHVLVGIPPPFVLHTLLVTLLALFGFSLLHSPLDHNMGGM